MALLNGYYLSVHAGSKMQSQSGQSNGPCGVFWGNRKYLTECKKQTSERLLRQNWLPLRHKPSWISYFKASAPNTGPALSLQTHFIWASLASLLRARGKDNRTLSYSIPYSCWWDQLMTRATPVGDRWLFLFGPQKGELPVAWVKLRTCHGSRD